MDTLEWLVAAVPILSFGLIPVIATLLGGKPVEQSMGIALGGLAFALAVFLIRRPALDQHILLVGLASGLCWAVGSVGQFMGLTYLGVSRSMPISDGGQIVGTSLLGVWLGEWATAPARIFGFSALLLIIAGIVCTSYNEKTTDQKPRWREGLLVNLVSVVGFTLYAGVLKYYRIDGWSSILPQSAGQILGILLIALLFFRTQPFRAPAFKNGIVGIVWGAGNIALLLSQARLGLAVAYPVSQAAVIVSVLGGVYINKEHKTRREWLAALAGMALIAAGLVLIYLSTLHDG